MNLLLDQGLPRGCIDVLREAGLEASHTADLGFATASDEVIIECARRNRMVAVTYDSDFHQILAHTGATSPSVIRVRDDRMGYRATADAIAAAVRASRLSSSPE